MFGPQLFLLLIPLSSLTTAAIITEYVTVKTVTTVDAPTQKPTATAIAKAAIHPSTSTIPSLHPSTNTAVAVSKEAPIDPASSYSSNSDFITSVLSATNSFRHQHNAAALTWNDTLAEYAASHASDCVFQHTQGPYGENLAAGYASIEAAVDGWGNERQQYNFASGGFSMQTGHFTQLVWKATRDVGCGRIYCNKAGTPGWYLMCEYYPAGNVIGAFQQNVQSQI